MEKVTTKQVAEALNGRQYGKETLEGEEVLWDANGLIVVFGESDDLMHFCGAMYDELNCYDGGTTYITRKLELRPKPKPGRTPVTAVWCPRDKKGNVLCSWLIKTSIPHETFNIMEDGELYCKGIVFSINDLK